MRKTAILIACLALTGLAGAADAPSLESFFKHPEFRVMRLSPDGRHLAASVLKGDQTGIAILNIEDPSSMKVRSSFMLPRYENVDDIRWVSEKFLVLDSTKQEGTLNRPRETGRIYAMDVSGDHGKRIFGPTPDGGDMVYRRASFLHMLPDQPRRILLQDVTYTGNPQDPSQEPIAWSVDVESGRKSLEGRSPLEGGGLGVDHDGVIRFAYNLTEKREWKFAYRSGKDAEWRTFTHEFSGQLEFWGFADDNKHLYIKSRDENNMGVYRVNPDSMEFVRVLEADTFEPAEPIWDRDGDRLIGAIYESGVPESRFIDPDHEVARLWRGLQASMPDHEVRISNFTEDGGKAVVKAFSDKEPGVFLMLDVDDMAASQLAASMSWLSPGNLGTMRPISFEARDGMEIHGFLTLPPGVENPQDMPMVVQVHGGPHGPYDKWRFNPWVQTMATRGYAVLQINYRGSGGRGYQFQRDAYRQWGREMQDDITDGTRWAIEEGIAHPDRVCISGGSYGGFSAMSGVTREPDLYHCAFAFAGVYDLGLMREKGNIPSSDMGMAYLDRAVGTDASDYMARSPISHVDRIKADLLIAHGSEDEQAHYSQYHALVESLEEAGIPHSKLWVENEGHGFYEVENNVRLFGRALDMFDRTIGSGWSPSGDGAVASAGRQ